jgi:hypothetical protein
VGCCAIVSPTSPLSVRPRTNWTACTIALTLAIARGTVRRTNPQEGHSHRRSAGSSRSRSSANRASSSDDWMRGALTSTMPAASSSRGDGSDNLSRSGYCSGNDRSSTTRSTCPPGRCSSWVVAAGRAGVVPGSDPSNTFRWCISPFGRIAGAHDDGQFGMGWRAGPQAFPSLTGSLLGRSVAFRTSSRGRFDGGLSYCSANGPECSPTGPLSPVIIRGRRLRLFRALRPPFQVRRHAMVCE